MEIQTVLEYVKSRGVSDESIEEWEIHEGGWSAGNLRGRVCFSIRDWNGELLATAGRSIDGTKPKYWNTPYTKSRSLFGLNKAKNYIAEEGFAIVVEDYFSTIIGHQSGLRNIVAVCGTALSTFQLGLLARYTDTIMVIFDPDEAGKQSAKKANDLIVPYGLKVIPVLLDKDLDEAILEDPSLVERLRGLVRSGSPLALEGKILEWRKSIGDKNNRSGFID
jgi:DNA primase